MKRSLLPLVVLGAVFFGLQVEASPAGSFTKQLSSLLKWTARASPRTPQSDGNVLQFENGYLVETIVEGNKLGVTPHTIRVSPEGELFAVDSVNSNIVRITPPLSQYSRARLVAGSFQGYSGHVDGKPSEAKFNHPKGVTMDEKGNIYVADTSNLAIRKIGESGVTTIAGGKSNMAGYRDGPSEDARFSNDFDVIYVGSMCSLLVVDRGNAALRQISLQQEDCDYQNSSISASDIMMVVGAVLVGYISCLIQHGLGSSFFTKKKEALGGEFQALKDANKPSLVVESLKEDMDAPWPSFGRLLSDLSKFAMEAFFNIILCLSPHNLVQGRSKKGLTPLKDRLVMPEDKPEPQLIQKQKSSPTVTESLHAPNASNTCGPATNNSYSPNASNVYTTTKLQKNSKSSMLKDALVSNKHRKRQEYAELYGSGEASQMGSKSLKERVRHRHRDKSSEGAFGAIGSETKPVEPNSVDPKFGHFNIRNKYNPDEGFHF
ncbi:hypothetical protein Taro_024226 [Colocasia esculenta]|uniref:NHL repeat-containing protein n=1 Tax=Colocasia esculenta TaxID=4460 RepID=A0A843V8R9_COLES|nr:hypothetical protein [Colocasia esculenta]